MMRSQVPVFVRLLIIYRLYVGIVSMTQLRRLAAVWRLWTRANRPEEYMG